MPDFGVYPLYRAFTRSLGHTCVPGRVCAALHAVVLCHDATRPPCG